MPPRKYCGKRAVLPDGYTRRGTQYECLQTGFGVASALCRQHPRQTVVPLTLMMVFILLTFLLLVFIAMALMSRSTNENEDSKQKID